jgi:hypothetical protein
VENLRWRSGQVVYATLHVVGSDNNLGDVAPDPVEFAGRDAATNEWLRQTFAAAQRADAAGVLLVIQANPGFDASDPTRAPVRDPRTLLNANGSADGFTNFLRLLREETIAFGKPVVLVHGDSHYFRIDKPFQDEQGRRLENFTRLETPGDNAQNGNNDVHWVKVLVDPRERELFSFHPQTVPGNRGAVPAPGVAAETPLARGLRRAGSMERLARLEQRLQVAEDQGPSAAALHDPGVARDLRRRPWGVLELVGNRQPRQANVVLRDVPRDARWSFGCDLLVPEEAPRLYELPRRVRLDDFAVDDHLRHAHLLHLAGSGCSV